MNRFLSLRAKRSNPAYIRWIAASAFVLLAMTFAFSTSAQETEQPAETEKVEAVIEEEAPDPALTYSPDFCEFSVTFPEAPYSSRRCEDDTKERCYDLVSYTQVHEMSSTVNFRIICNPIDASVYEEYSAEVMQTTLRAMTRKTVVEEFNSGFREEDGYKQAGLAGGGTVGRTPMIYIAQLWIGKQSAFSVEAELIGEAHEAADTLFSDILKTVYYSGVKELEPPVKTVVPARD